MTRELELGVLGVSMTLKSDFEAVVDGTLD